MLILGSFDSSTVHLLAGTRIFHVHEHILTSSSQFIKSAMNPEWRRRTKPLDLSDDDPAHFQAYCEWLYTKKIVPKTLVNGSSRTNNYLHLAHLYVLGAKLMDKPFQKHVLRAVVDNITVSGSYPSYYAVRRVYEGTTTDDPARRLLADFWAFRAEKSWVDAFNHDIVRNACTDFANDVIKALMSNQPSLSQSPP
jgi:hypothetical protein